MNNHSPLLELQQLRCERDGRVLFSGIDCRIDTGELIQIKGPNGCGKTTLLRIITQLLSDYEGQLFWCGQPVAKVRYDFLSQLLFIGHLPGVRKTLTVQENLAFLSSLQAGADQQQINEALAQVGLYGYEQMPTYQLSAGQTRRIALARLYLPQAMSLKLWVLDEPYTALDVDGIHQLEERFTQYTQAGGSIIFTSHQAPQLAQLRCLSLLDYQSESGAIAQYEGEYA